MQPRMQSVTNEDLNRALQNWRENMSTLSPDLKDSLGMVYLVEQNVVAAMVEQSPLLSGLQQAQLQAHLHSHRGAFVYLVVNELHAWASTTELTGGAKYDRMLLHAIAFYCNAVESSARQFIKRRVPGDLWKTLPVTVALKANLFQTPQTRQQMLDLIEASAVQEEQDKAAGGAIAGDRAL